MATSTSIRGACGALLGVLQERAAGFPGARFEVYDERSFRAPMERGVSLWVFGVTPDAAARQTPVATPRVVVHILLTPWAPTPLERLELLDWIVGAVHEAPVVRTPEGAAYGVVMRAMTDAETTGLSDRIGPGMLPTSCACECRAVGEPARAVAPGSPNLPP